MAYTFPLSTNHSPSAQTHMASSNSTISLAPINHKERYHNNEIYALPSDEEEANRLQLQHNLLRTIFDDRVVLAPLELTSGAEVLDIGTGKGSWALDFAATYPNADKASLLCIDIGARLFPQYPPLNVAFQLGDILKQNAQEWENRFAFVHQRLLIFAFKYQQWNKVIRKIYTITAQELLEGNFLSHFVDCGPVTARAVQISKALEKALGLDFLCSLRLEGLMKKHGFINVEVILRETPIGASYGEMGTKVAEDVMGVFRGFKSPTLRLGGFGLVDDEEDYDNLMDQMELEWNQPGCKVGWYVAIGRKV
ncbi:hypothetical protein D9619_004197 [Psilocybe cf. subviscida]|uniref:S-adenosyl-L-methionine-dependent methyltransferase n=1 Tax=Psilocybe cf. subviscida TaxID=2480587 RepID=A0A8H5BQM4_9AGAR|nr:hypothetical protein D9619_004197 [Psilocybe cf. subviscida]